MKEPIRILMLFTIMNRGGAESMVMNYYRNINRNLIQFDFIVHRAERGAYDDEIEALGGNIYRMMPLHPFTFKKYKKQIASFFDEHKEYKIIHGHCSESGYFIYKEANKRNIPVIIAHAHNSHAMFDSKWWFRTYFKHAMRKYVTHIFTCGKESAVWLAGKELSRKAIMQRNAIETDNFLYSHQNRIETREKLEITSNTLLIGHIGRFEKQKNHSFLIDVFKEIVSHHPDSILILIGSGGDNEEYIKEKAQKSELSKHIRFLGTRKDIPQLLHSMDIFLFPSFMEGMSLAMLEAQCSGLTCIVSDTIPNEIKITDLISFISLKKQPKHWAEKVLAFYKEKKDRTIYAQIIKEAGYDIKQNVEWLQKFYIEQWQKH